MAGMPPVLWPPLVSNCPPAATAPMSAPTLMVLAASNARMAMPTSQVGNLRRRLVPNPTPVWSAMRAHDSWTATISGKVKSAVQRNP